MSEQKLIGVIRTEFGKGAARQARLAEKIPAVIYGHGAEPLHVLLPVKETTLAVRTANALLSVDVEGTEHLALAKDVQRNPVKQIVEHIDLLTVRRGEKVQVEVNIHIQGEVKPGAVMNLETPTVTVEAEATHLPNQLVVTVTGHDVGDHVYASDVILPQNVEMITEAETLIVNVASPVVEDLGESATPEDGVEGEAASGDDADGTPEAD